MQGPQELAVDKTVVCCKEIPFFGHIIGDGSVKGDPNRVKAILNTSKATNVKELQTILGVVDYLHGFIPNLSIMSTQRPMQEEF